MCGNELWEPEIPTFQNRCYTVKSSQKIQEKDGGEVMTMKQELRIQKGKNIFTPKL